MFELPPPLRRPVYAHAGHAYALGMEEVGKPYEACGLVVRDGGELAYLACANMHPDPTSAFRIAADTWEENLHRLVAVVHSHPDKPACPSAADMRGQIKSGVPWVIIAMQGDRIMEEINFPVSLDEPIMGLPFKPGVRDCFTLVRKWWWQNKGVILPEFPRNDAWWADENGGPGEDLYMEGYAKAGFRLLAPEEIFSDPENKRGEILLQPGAVGLGKVLSPHRINHAVVYTGGQLMMHHLFHRVGAEEPISRWLPKIEHWVWREDAHEQNPPLRDTGGEVRPEP